MAIVLTVDQRRSRRGTELVEAAVILLRNVATVRPFERTACDELQGLLEDPQSVVDAVLGLLRDGHWSIGAGIGAVELPLPASTRAGRGPAFSLARTAVEAAKRHPAQLAVRGTDPATAQDVAAVAGLLAGVLRERTPAAWEAIDLVRGGLSQGQIATELGISRQAVSQRLGAAKWRQEQEVRPTLVRLIAAADAAGTDAAGTGAAGTGAYLPPIPPQPAVPRAPALIPRASAPTAAGRREADSQATASG